MSKSGYQGQVGSMVPNAAARDTFDAPDSTASRPNPGIMEDRPAKPQDVPSTLKTPI